MMSAPRTRHRLCSVFISGVLRLDHCSCAGRLVQSECALQEFAAEGEGHDWRSVVNDTGFHCLDFLLPGIGRRHYDLLQIPGAVADLDDRVGTRFAAAVHSWYPGNVNADHAVVTHKL